MVPYNILSFLATIATATGASNIIPHISAFVPQSSHHQIESRDSCNIVRVKRPNQCLRHTDKDAHVAITPLIGLSSQVKNTSTSLSSSFPPTSASASVTKRQPHIIFPGGGIFFYWQAGAVTYLRERGYDLSSSSVSLTGASAGALTATLTATDVDFEQATNLALNLAEDAGVWERPLGLQGIWGGMIESWLDQLLPDECIDMVGGDKLSLLITPVPSFGKSKISNFKSKHDLIQCNMASVHLPIFLNGKLTATFRDEPHIDGSFLSKASDYIPKNDRILVDGNKVKHHSSIIRLDWQQDPIMAKNGVGDFVKAFSKDSIWGLLEQGRSYAIEMERRGDFQFLES